MYIQYTQDRDSIFTDKLEKFDLNFCNSQNIHIRYSDNQDTILTDKYERFDLDLHLEQSKGKTQWYYIYETGMRVEINDFGPNGEYQYEIRTYIPNSYYILHRMYYSNCGIYAKALTLNRSPNDAIGLRYEFDRDGNLTEIIDYDKDFTFTWSDVLAFCAKEDIPIMRWKYPFPKDFAWSHYASIYRKASANKVYWIIEIGVYNNRIKTLTLDGKTGKVLKTEYANKTF